MNVNFEFDAPSKNTPVIFEQVWGEKPGGGMITAPTADILPSTAVGYNSDGDLKPIKAYRVVEDAASNATSIKVEKGSNVASGDIIGKGGKSVASTAVDTTNADYDVVTVSLGVAVKAGDVLYQSGTAANTGATPIYTPIYLTGNYVDGGKGDAAVRLINGANVRKETAQVSNEVVALMKGINLV